MPKLVNRGPAGLLTKINRPATNGDAAFPFGANEPVTSSTVAGKLNDIAPALKALTVPLDSLTLDPDNARLHPERNLEAIKLSLSKYGQVKPVVVRKATRVIVAGNGTAEAARALGWTKIAASFVDMTAVDAAGYGLADNRTAELARWDFEVVARLDKLVAEQDAYGMVGWTPEELMVLRQLEGNGEGAPGAAPQGWEGLWKGMPEFDQQDLTSVRHVVVHFRCEEDFLDFLRAVGQETGDVRQKSIWHPKAQIDRFADKRYANWEAE